MTWSDTLPVMIGFLLLFMSWVVAPSWAQSPDVSEEPDVEERSSHWEVFQQSGASALKARLKQAESQLKALRRYASGRISEEKIAGDAELQALLGGYVGVASASLDEFRVLEDELKARRIARTEEHLTPSPAPGDQP